MLMKNQFKMNMKDCLAFVSTKGRQNLLLLHLIQ